MAANLIINHGFKGYLFDGDASKVAEAKSFFAAHADCALVKPEITCSWITRENVNALLMECGAQGEVDLLSLDLDGNDYFIWEATEEIRPRICVFETHSIIPSDLALTVPYDSKRDAMSERGPARDFASVSLAAMEKLSRRKGYTLVGGHRHGFNLFFVRNDLLNDMTPRATVAEVHDNEWSQAGQRERWPQVKHLPWEPV